MLRLIRASLIRYFKSPLFFGAMMCSLVLGIIHGIKAWHSIHFDLDYYNYYMNDVWMSTPMSDRWLKMAVWILIVLISLEIGREFSDGTIRNKLYIGYTKKTIYLAETVVSFVVTLCIFLTAMIPTVIGGYSFFFTIPATVLFRLLGELFLLFLVWSVISAALTMVIANRAVGVVAVFSIMLFLAILNVNLRGYYYNTDPAEVTEIYIEHSAEGKPYAVERTVRNRWYLERLPKKLVEIEHEINPFSRLYNACNYAYLHHPEKASSEAVFEVQLMINRQITADSFILVITGIFVAAGGLVLFQRSDLK